MQSALRFGQDLGESDAVLKIKSAPIRIRGSTGLISVGSSLPSRSLFVTQGVYYAVYIEFYTIMSEVSIECQHHIISAAGL